MSSTPAPYRRFGEYRMSACDYWNLGEPEEDETDSEA